MTAIANPNIVTSGLTLIYDMNNTARSWKGQPATNLIPYSQDYASNGNFLSNWTGNLFNNWINSTITTGYTAPDGSPTANLMTGYYSRWTASISASTSTTYTFSVWLKNYTLVNDPYLHIAFGLDGVLVNYNNVTIVPRASLNDWTRFSVTVTSPSSGINQIQCGLDFGASKSNSSGPYSMLVWGAQCEVGSYASPYIPSLGTSSSRSNTQSLLDVSGSQNIITCNSLTYNSNNTFSFDGSTNYCLVNYSGFFDGAINNFRASAGYAWTVSAWFKFPVSPVNSKAGNASYAICGQSGGIGGGETLTLFVGSGTDNTYGNYVPYYCAVGIYGAKTIISPTSVNTNTWNNVVVTWDGSAGRVYFNGVDRGALTVGTASLQTGYYFAIGMTGTTGALNAVQCFEGNIGVLSVYNKGLTSSEVTQNFEALRTRYNI